MKGAAVALALAGGLTFVSAAAAAADKAIEQMTGCWLTEDFVWTSMLKDASDPASNDMDYGKMWLRFDVIPGTEYLVLGHIYEWDKAGTYVLGPIYENGVYNPALKHMTFGFPEGGLDQVTQSDPDHLLYVHTKAAKLSAMSVRPMTRISCEEAEEIETDLLARQKALKK